MRQRVPKSMKLLQLGRSFCSHGWQRKTTKQLLESRLAATKSGINSQSERFNAFGAISRCSYRLVQLQSFWSKWLKLIQSIFI